MEIQKHLNLNLLNEYCENGWLVKQSHPTLPLLVWNYSPKTQYECKWDKITLMCRGGQTLIEKVLWLGRMIEPSVLK